MHRRRFVAIAGAAVALGARPGDAAATVHIWRGTALGARASLRLVHPHPPTAAAIAAGCVEEVRRLEAIFSLYREDSALSRLNRDGRLVSPPFELLELLGRAESVRRLTDGAFDVRVQPLWRAYEACVHARLDLDGPEAAAWLATAATRMAGSVDLAPGAVELGRAGMELTLNGIAQGYIADRIAARLRREGIGNLLLDLGEIRGEGERAPGRPWRIATGDGGAARTVELTSGAIATSDPAGTAFDAAARHHHLFDPTIGRAAATPLRTTVIAESATLADALSTALAVRPALTERVRRASGVEILVG